MSVALAAQMKLIVARVNTNSDWMREMAGRMITVLLLSKLRNWRHRCARATEMIAGRQPFVA
jgi:tryptophan 2,3-dioxygenase